MVELSTPRQAAQWLHTRVSGQLHVDSRKVQEGDGFIAWPGAATDGRRYVPAALAQGARACLVERAGVEAFALDGEAVATYADLKSDCGPIAAAYYEDPSRQLDVLAITGTNGKTSTAWWLAQALEALEPARPCGVIGTLGVGRVPKPGEAPKVVATGLTTPDPVLLQGTLREFVEEGLRACAIEASSIGVVEGRLDATQIRTAVLTNFTQDHLDYHGSMDAYWAAKAALFDWPGLRSAVLNIDDPKGAELAQVLGRRSIDLWTVSCVPGSGARLVARDIAMREQGLHFNVQEGVETIELATQTVGQYNVSNLLGVIATLRSLGVPLVEAVRACRSLQPVPGRMEFVAQQALPLVVVDYAHTPDALDKALQALRPLAQGRGGRLWCVFGCGGDRDPHKRPLMGSAASRNADHVVVTSDNPRGEKPETIIAQIRAGIEGTSRVEVEVDRARAIAKAVREAGPRDVVLLAGKGHEDYQETAGVRAPFSDRLHARLALDARAEEVAT